MTIRLKNRLTFVLIFISIALLLSAAIASVLGLYLGKISFPSVSPTFNFQEFFIFRYRPICIFISVFSMLVYTLVFLIAIGIQFEKSQSSEIIFLMIFLSSCLPEAFRLLFPLANLWETGQSLAVIATRFILAGRIASCMSLFFMASYSRAEYRQFLERNIMIILVVALIFAVAYPVNTNVILPEGRLEWGLSYLVTGTKAGLLSLAVLSQSLESLKEKASFRLAVGIFLIAVGYSLLHSAYNVFTLAFGIVPLILGTIIYVKKLHRQYLWND